MERGLLRQHGVERPGQKEQHVKCAASSLSSRFLGATGAVPRRCGVRRARLGPSPACGLHSGRRVCV